MTKKPATKKPKAGVAQSVEPAPSKPMVAGSSPAPRSKRQAVDWERVETQFRAGVMSVREIAAEHGVSHVAVGKHAKKEGWSRDLKAKVQAKADELVTRQLVTASVTAETKITEALTVEVEAQVQARLRIEHRRDIGRGRNLTMNLLAELERQTDDPGLFEQLGELMIEPEDEESSDAKRDRQRKLREAYQRVLSLPGRADTLKKLADALRILIDKEREAFGMTAGGEGGGEGAPFTVVVKRYS